MRHPQKAMTIQREGGFQKEAVFEEVGVGLSRSFFLGLQVMIGEVLKTNSCLVAH